MNWQMKSQKGLDSNMFLKKLTALIMSLFFFLATTPVLAQDTLTTTSSNTPPIFTFLHMGEAAPFDGTLFSPGAVAELLEGSEHSDLRCQLKVDEEVAKTLAKCKMELDLIEADLHKEQKRNTLILTQKDIEIQQLTELANEPSYNWLWASGGVLAGVLLTLGVVSAVSGITK